MNQKHITSREWLIHKVLADFRQRCLSYSPGLEHLSLESLNWLNCIDLTQPSCEWWIAVFSFSETKPVFKGSSNKLRSAFGGFVAEKHTQTVWLFSVCVFNVLQYAQSVGVYFARAQSVCAGIGFFFLTECTLNNKIGAMQAPAW